MSMRPACLVAACISALCLLGAPLSAQSRFEVLTQHAMPDVSGLRIVTIRDNQLSACYTLFVMQSVAATSLATEAVVPDPSPINENTRQSVQRIRDAATNRDREIAALMSSAKASAQLGLFGEDRAKREFEQARVKIEQDYERVLRAEIPASYPWASSAPGLKSGGFEDSANAMRRAIVDPDPTSTVTMTTMADHLARLDGLLRRLIEEPRLAVSGPVVCAAAGSTASPPKP